ncbi:putative polyketide synthase [Melanogaster broomeanus]|nr:putative polyketide synthase [Melanogaster broomeanus]
MFPPESTKTIIVPLFSSQGSGRAMLEQANVQAVRDAASAFGSLLLSSCLDAFLAELCVLSPEELDQSGICPSDFSDPHSLLSPQPKYLKNRIVSGTFLFLAQVLRYQSYVQSTFTSHLSRDFFQTNIDHGVGVLGLSSGIYPACVVAASRNAFGYISTAVDVFRLVFWIEFRVLQFTRKMLREGPVDCTLPWSVTCIGLTKADIQERIARLEQKLGSSPSLRVTAVLDENYVMVSGRPDMLHTFSAFVSQCCTVHDTTVDALYHSPLHLLDTRGKVLADVIKRKIRFPDYHDLHCPLRSTISGELATPTLEYPSLIHLVVDMVLTHPVNWDLVAKGVASTIPPHVELRAVNLGPSSAALRALEKALPEQVLRCIDATSDLRDEAATTSPKQEPVAIVGMAAHTPGASDTSELWEILERGISTVSEIPKDRCNLSFLVNDETTTSSRAIKVETGNFMSNFAYFDNKFFNISPREARSMDPQQRVLLHTAYEALENAGYVPDATPSFRRETFGCYIGAATHDYADKLRNEIDIHYSTGTLKAFLSGRISYFMQFGGPSIVVDTSCSSSMVAIYQACRALMNKDCNAALAGGVNIMSSPDMFIGLERGHFLNTSGQCKTFDASADGYSRGEGCCLFVLKRLCDAIAENDNIIGVIRGVEVNQSGLAPSITHPHSPTQSDLLRKLLESSGIPAPRVSVVEAHGTGTQAGDPCEVASLRSVLAQGRTRENSLHITSVKANIGHLEAASGAVGLCKLLLMLRHNMIPAQISLNTLNPRITPLDVDNTVIDTLPSPWVRGSTPRVALLNNFGAAGSNGALVLEEYIKPVHQSVTSFFVLGISAKSADALENQRSRSIQWLRDTRNHEVPLSDIAYTATARRQLYPFRLAVTAGNKEELLHGLGTASPTYVTLDHHGGRVVFVFCGQGSQYLNMGTSLYATSPVFKSCIDRCILPITTEFEARQSAILALEFALSSLWKYWGLVPAGVIGQSLGEYAAMVTAEILSIETALSIVAKRARLMAHACPIEGTGMLSVSLASQEIQEILDTCEAFPNATVACINTVSSCVVSGPIDELRMLAAYLSVVPGCKTMFLGVPLGFHSAAMDPILSDLKDHVASLPINVPSIPIASNVSGTVILPGDGLTFQAEYFAQHCRQPVLFAQGLQALEKYLDPVRINAWIDIGPHATCLPMIEATLTPSSNTLLLPSMLKDVHPWNTLSDSLSCLYRTDIPVDWRRVFTELSPAGYSCVDLPSYPFEMQEFWVAHKDRVIYPAPAPTVVVQTPDHPMLSSWSQYPSRQNGNVAVFDTPLVGGYALCAVLTQRHMSLDFGRCMATLHGIRRIDGTGAFILAGRKYSRSFKLALDPCNGETFEVFTTRIAYEVYFKDYHTIQSLTVSGDGTVGVAHIVLPACSPSSLAVRPVFIDTMLHVAGDILQNLIDDNQTYTIHCNNSWTSSRDFVFRRVRLTSLQRGLAIASDITSATIRKSTDSNAIITPSSPRGVIPARSPSATHSTTKFCRTELAKLIMDEGESCTTYSEPLSARTLVSESGSFERLTNPQGYGRGSWPRRQSAKSKMILISWSLGLDSLGSIETQQALRVALNKSIPHNVFTTVRPFCLCVRSKMARRWRFVVNPLWNIGNFHPTQRWFPCNSFLVHDGSGLVTDYEDLSPLNRDVWGLSDPRFFSDERWESIQDMAQAYALAVERHSKDALILGGWSFGGVVAFEVARILTARGIKVKGVVLIDSPAPSAPPLLSDAIIDHVVHREEHIVDSVTTSLVMHQFKRNTQLLGAFVPAKQDTQVPLTFLRSSDGFCPPGIEDIPSWFSERNNVELVVGPWEALVGEPVKVWDIPGHHFEPFSSAHVSCASIL